MRARAEVFIVDERDVRVNKRVNEVGECDLRSLRESGLSAFYNGPLVSVLISAAGLTHIYQAHLAKPFCKL